MTSSQHISITSLIHCLRWIADYYQHSFDSNQVLAGLPVIEDQMDINALPRLLEKAGFKSYFLSSLPEKLESDYLPCMILLDSQEVALLTEKQEAGWHVLRPSRSPETVVVSEEQLSIKQCLLIKPAPSAKNAGTESPTDSRRWLISILSTGKTLYRDALLASVMVNVMALTIPLFVRLVYDRVLPGLAFTTLNTLVSLAIVLVIFECFIRQLRTRFIDLAAKKVDIQMSSDLCRRMLQMNLSAHQGATGAFARQMQDFEAIREFIASATLAALVDIPFAFLFLVVIALMAGGMVWITVIPLIILAIAGLLVQWPLRHCIEEGEKLSTRRHGDLIETLMGLESLKLSSAEGRFQQRWEQSVAHSTTWTLRTRTLTSGIATLATGVQQLTTVAILFAGVHTISSGSLNPGGLIAVMMLSGRAIAPFVQTALLSLKWHHARSSWTFVSHLLKKASAEFHNDLPEPDRGTGHLLIVRQVSFTYPNTLVPILRSVDFALSAGEKVSLVGRAGSGKTTLARLLSGLYPTTQGQILLDDTPVSEMAPNALTRVIGSLPQSPWLFTGSIRDNILMGRMCTDERTGESAECALLKAAEAAGVTLFTGTSSGSFSRQVGECGKLLSAGQRRAVALARTLISRPDILILDEPTAQMDHQMEKQVEQMLKNLPQTTTLILISHNPRLINCTDRVIVLESGKRIADGKADMMTKATETTI